MQMPRIGKYRNGMNSTDNRQHDYHKARNSRRTAYKIPLIASYVGAAALVTASACGGGYNLDLNHDSVNGGVCDLQKVLREGSPADKKTFYKKAPQETRNFAERSAAELELTLDEYFQGFPDDEIIVSFKPPAYVKQEGEDLLPYQRILVEHNLQELRTTTGSRIVLAQTPGGDLDQYLEALRTEPLVYNVGPNQIFSSALECDEADFTTPTSQTRYRF